LQKHLETRQLGSMTATLAVMPPKSSEYGVNSTGRLSRNVIQNQTAQLMSLNENLVTLFIQM
jgi:hypothetical protein